MKNLNKYLIILVLFLILCTLGVTYAYFDATILVKESYPIEVKSGNILLNISDVNIKIDNIIPIYDEDYLTSYNKEFAISNTKGTLNSCVNLYLEFNSIDNDLISKDIKYKLVSSTKEYNGDFSNIKDNKLLLGNDFIKSEDYEIYNLYIWISYNEEYDQMNLLNKNIISKIYIQGYDNETNNCEV